MKQRLFYFFRMTVFSLCILTVQLALAACENFLEGESARNAVIESINRNNAQDCTVLVKSDDAYGSFISSGEKTFKVGYEQSLQFAVNSADYIFFGLEAVCKTDVSSSRSDCVQFVSVPSKADELRGLYTVNVKILKKTDDILIRPLCYPLPAVKSFYPSDPAGTYYANTSVVINFNMSLPEFSPENISITLSGGATDMKECFETPVFSPDGMSCTIAPKPQLLKKRIIESNSAFLEINFAITGDIKINRNGNELTFKKDGSSSFSIRYLPLMETTLPVCYDFFVSREKFPLDMMLSSVPEEKKFINETIEKLQESNEKIICNRTAGRVYVYGKYYDEDSGVRNVTVNEKRTNSQDGDTVLGTMSEMPLISREYRADCDGAEFLSDGSGYTVFCIEHVLDGNSDDPKNGAVRLDVQVADACGNLCTRVNSLAVIKADRIITENISVRNLKGDIFTPTGNGEYIMDYELYCRNVRKLYIDDWTTNAYYQSNVRWDSLYLYDGIQVLLYKNAVIRGKSLCAYAEVTDEEGRKITSELTCDESEHIWLIDYDELFGQDDFSGKTLKITVCDPETGISGENIITLPSRPELLSGNSGGHGIFNLVSNDNRPHYFLIWKDGEVYRAKFYDQLSVVDIIPPGNSDTDYYLVSSVGVMYSELSSPVNPSRLYDAPRKIRTSYPAYELSKGNYKTHVGITVNLASDIWDYNDYDSIYLKYESEVTKYFDAGTTSCSFDVIDSNLMFGDRSILVYGVKDGIISEAEEIIIKKLSNEQMKLLDNNPPEFYDHYLSITDYETFRFFCSDNNSSDSGMESFEIKLNNQFSIFFDATGFADLGETRKGSFTVNGPYGEVELAYKFVPETYSADSFYIYIPSYFLKKDYNSLEYDMLDRAGNRNKGLYEFRSLWHDDFTGGNFTPEFKKGSDGKWTVTAYFTDPDFYLSGVDNLNFYALYSNGQWKSFNPGLKFTLEKGKSLTLTECSFPQECFIRMALKNYSVCPVIFYTGSSSGGKHDYIILNGTSASSAIVSSDDPVFVHTVVTDAPYSECSRWNYMEWERGNLHIGDEYMDFSLDNRAMRYSIPCEKIRNGLCYCVIAHFADNHVEMTPVMQK